MNYYSSLIYIAFFKGRFFDYPGYVRPPLLLVFHCIFPANGVLFIFGNADGNNNNFHPLSVTIS